MARKPIPSPDDDLPPPASGVRKRFWKPDIVPARAWPLLNSGNYSEEVLAIAVEVHNAVADPTTGTPYDPEQLDRAATAAVGTAWTAAQEDAQQATRPIDEDFAKRAATAAGLGHDALAQMADVDAIPDRMVQAPSSGQLSRREVANDHRTDGQLARAHEAEGDHRHQQREVPRHVIVGGAAVFGLVDLLLLYVPVFNLGSVSDIWDIVRWGVAIILSVAQAVFLEQALHSHRLAERDGTDVRNAIRDGNRNIRGGRPSATVEAADLVTVDAKLVRARFVLAVLVGITGVLTAVRVAILVREAQRPIWEAALFGAAVGLVLGLLIVVLARALCRGNALGDRLAAGGEIVAETDALVEDGLTDVRTTRKTIDEWIGSARRARTRGDEVRMPILAAYKQGIDLALVWLPPTSLTDSGVRNVQARPTPIVQDGDAHAEVAKSMVARITTWLREDTVVAREKIEAAPPPEPATVAATTQPYLGPNLPSRHFDSMLTPIPPMPPEPHRLHAAAAALTVVAAVVGAIYAPELDDVFTTSALSSHQTSAVAAEERPRV
jgi:hypothetical protein